MLKYSSIDDKTLTELLLSISVFYLENIVYKIIIIQNPKITIFNPINPSNIIDSGIAEMIQRRPNITIIIPKKYPVILLIHPIIINV